VGVTIKDNSREVLKVVTNLTGKGITSFTEKAHQRVQTKAPVDTGNHKGSIQWKPTGENSTQIYSSSNYGAHLEFGTVHQSAQPHFAPGITETVQEFQSSSKWK